MVRFKQDEQKNDDRGVTCKAKYGPDAEEADDADNDAGRGMSHSIQEICLKKKSRV